MVCWSDIIYTLNEHAVIIHKGTWSKKSKIVNGRKPFSQDTEHLNYEVDSEAEWEEDEPGEELQSDDEDEDADSQCGDEEMVILLILGRVWCNYLKII